MRLTWNLFFGLKEDLNEFEKLSDELELLNRKMKKINLQHAGFLHRQSPMGMTVHKQTYDMLEFIIKDIRVKTPYCN